MVISLLEIIFWICYSVKILFQNQQPELRSNFSNKSIRFQYLENLETLYFSFFYILKKFIYICFLMFNLYLFYYDKNGSRDYVVSLHQTQFNVLRLAIKLQTILLLVPVFGYNISSPPLPPTLYISCIIIQSGFTLLF